MTNVLPQNTGLSVHGVIYTYTVSKKPEDSFTVSVQNQNALGSGFIFRSTDDWTGLPGNTIAKSVPVNNIPFKSWGNGEIATTGFGTVKNPVVIYNYKIDTCAATPVTDQKCPNYIPPKIDTPSIPTDTTTEEFIKEVMAKERIDDLIGSDEERAAAARARANPESQRSAALKRTVAQRMSKAADKLKLPEQMTAPKLMNRNMLDLRTTKEKQREIEIPAKLLPYNPEIGDAYKTSKLKTNKNSPSV